MQKDMEGLTPEVRKKLDQLFSRIKNEGNLKDVFEGIYEYSHILKGLPGFSEFRNQLLRIAHEDSKPAMDAQQAIADFVDDAIKQLRAIDSLHPLLKGKVELIDKIRQGKVSDGWPWDSSILQANEKLFYLAHDLFDPMVRSGMTKKDWDTAIKALGVEIKETEASEEEPMSALSLIGKADVVTIQAKALWLGERFIRSTKSTILREKYDVVVGKLRSVREISDWHALMQLEFFQIEWEKDVYCEDIDIIRNHHEREAEIKEFKRKKYIARIAAYTT